MSNLIVYLLIFVVLASLFLTINLLVGKLVRPNRPTEDKGAIYECGEPSVGSSWIQFDLRFYVVALLFVVFDVEMALFFPWATVFGTANKLSKEETTMEQRQELLARFNEGQKPEPLTPEAVSNQRKASKQFAWILFVDIVIFFGLLLIGFAYLWKRGDIDWVRSTAGQEIGPEPGGVT
jgi:NADH-quinone oxidoreductase subunit A